ncbi:MAG: hypothetical protein V4613_07540 [Bacteroidota bacterium]
MLKLLTLLVIILCLAACNIKKHHSKAFVPFVDTDTTNYAVIPDDSNNHWYWTHEKFKPATFIGSDTQNLEGVLNQFVTDYNRYGESEYKRVCEKNPDSKINKHYFVIDLKLYKRQYVLAFNDKGEKEVWVNCFCDWHGSNWRKYIITVADGGICYFSLRINLSTKEYYNVMVNGDA